MIITDQNDAFVSASEPQIVPKGGDRFVISCTFTVPVGATRLCRTAVLQVGSVTLKSTGSSSIFPCVDVTQ